MDKIAIVSGGSSGLGRDGSTLSVLMAVRIKTLLPQMMGEALPYPSMGIFHWIFLSSLQFVGGLAVEEAPVASGPRQ